MTETRLYGIRLRGKLITLPSEGFATPELAQLALEQLPASDLPYAKVVPYLFDGKSVKKILNTN